MPVESFHASILSKTKTLLVVLQLSFEEVEEEEEEGGKMIDVAVKRALKYESK